MAMSKALDPLVDSCGWEHPYLGCPPGWCKQGQWHVGESKGCDGQPRGKGATNGDIVNGWMVLCSREPVMGNAGFCNYMGE